MVRVLKENTLSVLSDYLSQAIRMIDEDAKVDTSEFLKADRETLCDVASIIDDAIEEEQLLVIIPTDIN